MKEKNKQRRNSSVLTTFVQNKITDAEELVSKTVILIFFDYEMKLEQFFLGKVFVGKRTM